MADTNTRQGKRTPVTLKIKFKSETLEQFIERYAVDVSQGGIFIRTKEPLAVGTQMKFEFQLRDASPLIAGEGTVVWTRENDPSRPAIAPGMGVRFDKLGEGSQSVLERILAEKAKQAPARGNESVTKPPMFTDTPTRVAPAPVQDALGIGRGNTSNTTRRREDSEQTPLPKPMPFHSDADDFDERAFEEATKVRSLDELAAASAGLGGMGGELGDSDHDPATATKIMPADELAARRGQGRADSTLADPPLAEPPPEPRYGVKSEPDRESAPGLPSPPETRPKMLDTPSPRASQPSTPPSGPDALSGRTKLGLEAPKAQTRPGVSASDMSAAPRAAIANEPSRPHAPKRPSSAPVVIGILFVVAAVAVAVWYFVLREDKTTEVATKTPDTGGSAGSAVTPDHTNNGGSAGSAVVENTGSAGSGVAMTGSNTGTGSGSQMAATGSNAVPAANAVNTVIASSVAKGAVVEIVGTDMKGPAPFTAKLEKDKPYKARVTAPGFVAQEIDIKGGQDKATAKLVAKAKIISVTTDPAGADIWIDNVSTSKLTPADVQLTAAQAARPRVHVTLRRPGYKPADQFIDASAWSDGDAKMTANVSAKLQVAPKVVTPPAGGNTTNNNGAGSGATTPTGTGTGSASTGTGTGTGSATTGTGTGTTGTSGAGSAATPTPTPTPPAPAPASSAGSGAAAPGQTLK